MRKLLGGAAEDFCEPLDSFLMRYVHEVTVAKHIRQAVWAGVRRRERYLLRRPKVPPPRHKRQATKTANGSCYKNCCQNFSSHAREFRPCLRYSVRSRLQASMNRGSSRNPLRSIEVSLQRSSSADIQGNAMGPTTQHFGVPQFQGDHIKTLLLQKFHERRLIPINHDQIRTDAEGIHIDPVTANAFGTDSRHHICRYSPSAGCK